MKTIMLWMLLVALPALLESQEQALTLVAEKETYVVGEPVVVYVTVTNIADKVANVPTLFGPEYDVYVYSVQGPDGKATRFSPLMVKETYAPGASLQKGQSVSGSARIYFGAHGYSFSAPGSYSLRCSYGPLTSNALVLKFVEPRTAAERAFAEAMLKHGEVGLLMMMEGGDELKDGIAQLEKFVAEYPGTTYSGVAGYILGKNYSKAAMNFVSKKPRAADLAKANKYLETAKPINLGTYYIRQLHATLSDNYVKLKNADGARMVNEELQQRLKALGVPGNVMLEEHVRLQAITR
jgi:hypothetical protein